MRGVVDESFLRSAVLAGMHVVEACGAVIIFAGAIVAMVRVAVSVATRRGPAAFVPVRLDMARFLALGLEFQLAADLLRTAISPTFEEIGKLASIAAIRTALNFFLGREIDAERREVARSVDDLASSAKA